MSDVPKLVELCQLVKEVASTIPVLRSGRVDHLVKLDGSFVTEVDHQLQVSLVEALRSKWPQYGAVGEEMEYEEQLDQIRSGDSGYWILDPLDGTTNFISGFLFFGISLALAVDGQTRFAVVYDPMRDECFSAEQGKGAYLNGVRLANTGMKKMEDCIANVDYKRLTKELASNLVRCPPYRSQRNLGSSVLEWCWLASGRIQLYLHGGQKLWDFAAGHLILVESGGIATSISGNPLECDKLRKRSVVAATTPELLSVWKAWIDDHRLAHKTIQY